jgi:hypothetical protein
MVRHIIGFALAVAGGVVLGVLFYPSFAHTLATGPQLTASMPGALLLGMIALIAIAWGGHLVVSGRVARR